MPANAEIVSLGSACDKALQRSYDLVLGAIDTGISKNKIREAKVSFYPTLNGSVNTEYVGGFGNQNTLQNQSAVVVGNTILPGNTRFQNAISLNANYTIADFGVRSNQLRAAKQHAHSSEIQQKIQVRDLRLDVLDAYTQALLTYKEMKSKEHQLRLQAEQFELKTRLWHSGKISRIELGEQAIIKGNTETELQAIRQSLGEKLNKLSSYTQEPYHVSSVQMDDLDPDPSVKFEAVLPANLPDFKAYDLLIKEKQSEMQAIRAQRMPQLVAFGNFVLYGANKGNWINSMGGIAPRAVYMGIGMQLPVFDGFKSRVAVDGKKLEIARLIAERNKKLWSLRSDYEKSATAARLYGVELTTRAELVTSSKDQLTMVIRLTESQVAERTKALTEQIDLAKRQLDEDTTRVKSISAALRLKIYSETASK
ncbi:MAG: TolC family protein [Candidatus Obscuribacterales bacterium]|nr:TolC family protein [Candidatus Obscuribacterales bacterium]